MAALKHFILVLGYISLALSQDPSLTVTAPSGTYTGIINGTVPNVRQFLGIPYALPPLGGRRWLPPVKPDFNSSTSIQAVDVPPGCPQYASRIPQVYSEFLFQNTLPFGSQSHNPGTMVWSSNEDCLYHAVWTPKTAKAGDKLPVIVFIAGGGFINSGSVDAAWYKPHHWVERSQSHIAVSMNYRLNVIGFPNAAGLQEQNLGFMDQRMVIEWVRDNIEAFGGDPDRITLWGESAGAVSTDFHNFAFPDNPIVKGFYMDSGSSIFGSRQVRTEHTGANFTFVASNLGCGGLDPIAELVCMRNVSVYDIITFMGQFQDNSSDIAPQQPLIVFLPVADENLIFSNYTQQYVQGHYAMLPAIYSMCANEIASLPHLAGVANPPSTLISFTPEEQEAINNSTLDVIVCPALVSSQFRAIDGIPTYRFQYAGNFTNISPLPYLGAYHASDLPMLTGAFQDFNGPGPEIQYQVSAYMQDLLLAFMKDPYMGPQTMGWQADSSGTMLRIGAAGQVTQTISVHEVDNPCSGMGTYDPFP